MNLSGTQLKDTYGNLLTIGTSAGSPTTGTIENGDGQDITILTVAGKLVSTALQPSFDTSFYNVDGTISSYSASNYMYVNGLGGASGQGLRLNSNGSATNFIALENSDNSITLNTNSNERLRIDSGGDISFRDTSNNEAFYWDASAGSLGIGTTDTGNAGFSVSKSGDGGNNVYARINGVATANEAGLQFADQNTLKWTLYKPGSSNNLSFYNHTGGSIAMTLDSSGNVGIGVSPSAKLHVNDTTYPTLRLSTATSYSNIYHDGTTGSIAYSADDGGAIASSSHQFYIDGAPAMKLDGTGLGIGTTSPSIALHVSSTAEAALFQGSAVWGTAIQIDATGTGGRNYQIQSTADSASEGGGKFIIVDKDASSTTRLAIDSSGQVGIGVTSPDRNLHIETSGDSYVRVSGNRGNSNDLHVGNIEFENSFGSAGVIAEMRAITGNSGTQSTKGQLAFYTDDGSTYAERMRILSGGGLTFNGDTATANALNDYEEGTFTVTLQGATTAGTYTFSTNLSHYTKIGRQVTVTSRLVVDTASGGVGESKFGGLPFTKVTNSSFTGSVRLIGVDVDNSTINISAIPWTTSGSTEFTLSSTLDNASASNLDIAGISTGDTIEFSFTYFV